MARRTTTIVVAASVCVAVLAAALSVYLWWSWGGEEGEEIGPSYISELHLRLDAEDIPELKEIIESHPDNYTRERAVFVLADIAIRRNKTEEVVDFLKGIAYDEENDDVRSAAYANLDLIREYYALETRGDLTIRVEGKIREGNSITLIADASSTVDVDEAIVGVRRIAEFGTEETVGVELDPAHPRNPSNPMRISLKAGESKEIPFTIHLRKEGEYLILCALKLNIDRVDYQTIEKKIHLTVEKTGGTFETVP